jgi:Flp pilus assembly pilin Flp
MGFIKLCQNAICKEEGQTLAEYGLVLVLIMVVAAVAVALLGNTIVNLFNQVVAAF